MIPKYHTSLLKKCVRKSDSESALKIALLLPEAHLSVLCLLCDLLASIAAHFDVTHMDSRSLSIVMAPTLLHQEKMGACDADVKLYYPAILQVSRCNLRGSINWKLSTFKCYVYFKKIFELRSWYNTNIRKKFFPCDISFFKV